MPGGMIILPCMLLNFLVNWSNDQYSLTKSSPIYCFSIFMKARVDHSFGNDRLSQWLSSRFDSEWHIGIPGRWHLARHCGTSKPALLLFLRDSSWLVQHQDFLYSETTRVLAEIASLKPFANDQTDRILLFKYHRQCLFSSVQKPSHGCAPSNIRRLL
jgi:hypothetical protein